MAAQMSYVHGEATMAWMEIVTEAASGIGQALARALVSRGDIHGNAA